MHNKCILNYKNGRNIGEKCYFTYNICIKRSLMGCDVGITIVVTWVSHRYM